MSDAQTDVAALVERLREGLGGISTHMMRGDNLAILLCTFFENPDEVADDDFGWTPSAITGYEQVCDAIHAHYKPHLESQARELAEARARILELETVTEEKVERAAKAMCKADGWHNSKGYQSLARAALMAGR